jgi:pimeloyl-ACP methyl ester carboxylesterase
MRELRFDTGTVGINYAEGPPSGPPFVLLHGGSVRWQYGRSLLDLLSARWHVFAPDFRGHGRSGRVPGHYRLRDYAADIAAFLLGVVGEPAVIYGHSLGGEVGVMIAGEYPELVRALIVGDVPLMLRDHYPTEETAHRAQNLLWRDLAASDMSVEEIAEALKDMPVPAPGETELRRAGDVFGEDSIWFRFQAENLYLLDPEMLDAVLAGPEDMLAGYDGVRVLPAITCPVLIVHADPARGGGLTDADVEDALRLLPDGRHIRLDGLDHSLHATQAPRLLAAITPFLEEVRGGTSSGDLQSH